METADPRINELLQQLASILGPEVERLRRNLISALSTTVPQYADTTAANVLARSMPTIEDALHQLFLASALAGAQQVTEVLGTLPLEDLPAGLSPALASSMLDLLSRSTPELQESILSSIMPHIAAYARGQLGTSAKPVAQEEDFPGQRPRLPLIEAALSDIRSRVTMSKAEFDQLDFLAKQQAFTVAGARSQDLLAQIQATIADTIEAGASLAEFKRRVRARVLESDFLTPQHLETVFRTNVHQAYSAGQEAILSNPVVGDAFPYEETIPIYDTRLTELCEVVSSSGIQGTGIFRRDDPVWIAFKPPRHYNCRCKRNPLTLEQAAARGIREAMQWLKTGVPPAVPERVGMPTVRLPEGWVSA